MDAKAACSSQGMELAYPRNAYENAFIYTLIPGFINLKLVLN